MKAILLRALTPMSDRLAQAPHDRVYLRVYQIHRLPLQVMVLIEDLLFSPFENLRNCCRRVRRDLRNPENP